MLVAYCLWILRPQLISMTLFLHFQIFIVQTTIVNSIYTMKLCTHVPAESKWMSMLMITDKLSLIVKHAMSKCIISLLLLGYYYLISWAHASLLLFIEPTRCPDVFHQEFPVFLKKYFNKLIIHQQQWTIEFESSTD